MEPIMSCRFALLLICLLLSPVVWAQDVDPAEGLTETFHTVTLSRGGALNILVDKRKGEMPTTAVLLFAGFPGVLHLKDEEGNITYDLAGNFLIRARRFLNTDSNFTVMVDCPVDKWFACDDLYRSSDEHAADVSDVIAALKKEFGAQKIYIVGTSYGTVSSGFLARNLSSQLDGVIHTSTITDPRGAKSHGALMDSFDWSQAKVPQLFVHHKYDPCHATRYSSIVERKKDIPLITVEGSKNVSGEACEAFSAHGFVGREKAVMTAIGDWISNGALPAGVVNSDN
jgi:hypothetical protein